MRGWDRKSRHYGPRVTWKTWLLLPLWIISMASIPILMWLFIDTVLTIVTNK